MVGAREQQKKETRALLLKTARELFEERGFRKTTIKQVAEKAGVAVGTVFVHFPDKSALLAASFIGSIDEVVEKAFEEVPKDKGIVEILLHFARHLYSWYRHDPELTKHLLKESLFLGGESGEQSREQTEAFIFRLMAFVEEAKERGELDKALDNFLASLSFFASYFTVLIGVIKEPDSPLEFHLGMLEKAIRFQLRLPTDTITSFSPE